MAVQKKSKSVVLRKLKTQVEFVEKPITDPPPDTYPKSPEGNVCEHSNRVFVKGKAGFNCNDCGFFIPISALKKEVKEEEVVHVAVASEPVKLKMPKMNGGYNIMELPRACFDVGGEGFVKDEGFLGELDKKKMIIFNDMLKGGYKIAAFSQTSSNSYLFLLEK